MTMTMTFLDTNWFLHHQFPDQVDWCRLLGAGAVEIVLAPMVVRELNKHKDSPSSPKLRRRAAEVLIKIDDLLAEHPQAALRPDVTLRYETREPLIDLAAHQLSAQVPDDQLVASMIAQRDRDPAAPVVLVTADTGLRLKAQGHGFAIHRPAAAFKLPTEDDPQEKRIKELERENRDLRDRIPKVELRFADGERLLRGQIRAPQDYTAAITQKLAEVREKHPKKGIATPGSSPMQMTAMLASLNTLNQISAEDIAEYNEQLDRYYARYEGFLEAIAARGNAQRRTLRLDLILFNEGTAPAEDLDVFLHFPDGFILHGEDDRPGRPEQPRPPAQPRPYFERSLGYGIALPELAPRVEMPRIYDPTDPRIRRTNSYEVTVTYKRLKQQLQQALKPLWLTFDSYELATSFSVDYRLNAASLPHEKTGRLDVLVEKTK